MYSRISASSKWGQCRTHFSSSSDLLCCSALARALVPVSVRPLVLRLPWIMVRHEQLELDSQ